MGLSSEVSDRSAPGYADGAVDVECGAADNKGPDDVAKFCGEGEEGR